MGASLVHGRTEVRLPLEASGENDSVPNELTDVVLAIVRDRPLQPVARITTRVKCDDPRTARIQSGTVDGLRAWDGEEPAAVVLRPAAGRAPGPN